jgi:hypothetical protein
MTEPARASRRRPADTVAPDGSTPEERIAELEARLERVERSPGIRERGRGMMARVVPPDATEHFRNAGREQLLGIRSIVDFWINRLDDADARARRSDERERIEIELE